jgi:flagellin
MGFRIQNNIAAMNAQRNLGISDAGMSKSLERLSSGYRINKAADDAAGLSISQSFRADIASYKVAQRNVSEANSLIQVAEGSLDQVGNMLTRMKELATQAASANAGSNLDKIDAEYQKLMAEVDRVVNSTEYAGTSLLTGTFGASLTGSLGDAVADYGVIDNNVRWQVTGDLAIADADVTAFGSSTTDDASWTVATHTDLGVVTIGNGSVTESATRTAGGTLSFAGIGLTLTGITANTDIATADTVSINRTSLTNLNVSGAAVGTYSISDPFGATMTIGNGTVTETVSNIQTSQANQSVVFNQLGISFTLGTDYDGSSRLEGMDITVVSGGSGSVFQVGNKNTSANQISFSIDSANTDDIGKNATGATAASLNATDLSSAANAQDAMTIINQAIDDVNAIRGSIGANQNRLSYAAANLSTTVENITAADSVIRDVDMAAEMTSFTKNQILVQAGTSMLAQANMASQGVLSLFK